MTAHQLASRKLGADGPRVSAIGLGCMGMSDAYGHADEGESIATIHIALDQGITLLDTGDFYGSGHNELLIVEALRGRPRQSVQLSVKFGAFRDPAGGFGLYDARPGAVKNFLTYSLRRLRTDYIDIDRPARLDPNVPIEDTVGAIAGMVEAGYVRHIGLSEVSADTIRARRRERLPESLGAIDVSLSQADLAELARAIPRDAVAGARCVPAQMAMLDSEKAMVRA